MPDVDRATALQSLSELRDEFLAGPKHYPGLYHVLAQAATESHPMLAKWPPQYEIRLGPYLGGKYGTNLTAQRLPSWRHWYFGDGAGLNDFRMKAARAAKHLVSLGPEVLGQPAEVAGSTPPMGWEYRALWGAYGEFTPSYEAEFWLLVIHHLGWRRGGSDFFLARREIWAVDDSGTRWQELPGEPEAFTHWLSSFKDGPPEYLRRLKMPPDYFYSVLSGDVFSSSRYAIDMVLAQPGLSDALGRHFRGKTEAFVQVAPDQAAGTGPVQPAAAVQGPKDDSSSAKKPSAENDDAAASDQTQAGRGPTTPPYLGIRVDEGSYSVTRIGKAGVVRLAGMRLPWGLLLKFIEMRGRYCKPVQLDEVWQKYGRAGKPSSGTKKDAVNDLSHRLKPLGLFIKGTRGVGWRLLDVGHADDAGL